MVFGQYAHYYDALYAEKDYAAECDFLEGLFREYAAKPVQHILDLGCGTGGHAIPLARRGYTLTGVDRSGEMLAAAREKAAGAGVAVDFQPGDLREVEIGQTFDAVLAMFAVICYQTGNEDLIAAFQTARRHLRPGGLFIFDGWFGPAVLTLKPVERVKNIDLGEERMIRIARPALDELANTVRVDYTLLRLRGKQLLDEVNESHLMRFLFLPEIDLLCRMTGLELQDACPFLEPGREPSRMDWNVSWIARAI